MPSPPHFSVIIVTYNSEAWIEACLKGLSAQTEQDFEVIIIDNASCDDTTYKLAGPNLLQYRLISNDDNLGFAVACNQGAKLATGNWLVFLNPDTVPAANWLEEVSAGQQRHPNAAAFASAQLDFDDPSIIDGAGDVYSLYGIAWRGAQGSDIKALPPEGECFSPCGAAMIIRQNVFTALNGFEEHFFCYYEDIDLGFRMRLLGHYCIFLPKAQVRHKGGASSDGNSNRASDFSVFYGVRNRFWTYIRNMPLALLMLTLPIHVALAAAQVFSARKTGHVHVMLSALKAGLAQSPRMLAARSRRPSSETGQQVNIYAAFCKSIPKLLRQAPHVWSPKDHGNVE